MSNSDNKLTSEEELEKINAAFYKDGRFVWKSDLFLKMEEQLGEDLILDSVKMRKFPVDEDKEMIYRYSVTPAEKYDILIFSVNGVFNRLESKDTVDVMIKDIKNHVTNMSAQIEALSSILKENGVSDEKTDAILKHINKINMELWLKTMFPDLIREYELKMDLRSKQDSFYIDAMFIARVFAKHLSKGLEGSVKTTMAFGEGEVLVRYLNIDHLRIILSLAARKILSAGLKTDYINVKAAKNDNGTASISVTGGNMQGAPADPALQNSMSETLKDLPVWEFADLFCQKYNCKINSKTTEKECFVEIIMPAYSGAATDKDKVSVMANDKYKAIPAKYIPEFTVLSDIVDYEKIREEEKKTLDDYYMQDLSSVFLL